jgi:hypothetical protein
LAEPAEPSDAEALVDWLLEAGISVCIEDSYPCPVTISFVADSHWIEVPERFHDLLRRIEAARWSDG